MRSEQRQKQFDIAYMKMAIAFSKLSFAIRRKVGCVIVSEDDQVISQGFNGTPSGFDNKCEDDWCDNQNELCHSAIRKCKWSNNVCNCKDCDYTRLITKPSVIHAEANAITKCAKSHNSTIGSTAYITLSPCVECAKLIIASGISRVVYYEQYHDDAGIKLLQQSGISVDMLHFNCKDSDETIK